MQQDFYQFKFVYKLMFGATSGLLFSELSYFILNISTSVYMFYYWKFNDFQL